ncbi:MAG: hypothetical protein K8R35_03145, partial [Bacteroidales bacterium]|nr:hypothetical protein [Bacteroidales bacterium]
LVSQVHNFRTSKNYNWSNVDIGVNQQSHICAENQMEVVKGNTSESHPRPNKRAIVSVPLQR